MSKPTPGPWIVTHKGGNNFALQAFEFRSAGAYPIFSKSTAAIDGAIVYCSPEDAALIASAPDLLEALKLIHPEPGRWCLPNNEGEARIEAAISKAEGRAT